MTSVPLEQRPDRSAQSVQAEHGLVARGLAQLNERGKLRSTASLYDALLKSERARRKQQPTKAESGVPKNLSWRGPLLAALTAHAAAAVEAGLPVQSRPVALDGFRTLRSAGHDVALTQVQAALRLFKDCKSAAECFDTMSTHRSHGDFWRELNPEERRLFLLARRRAMIKKWSAVSEPERIAQRESVRSALVDAARQASRSGDPDRLLSRAHEIGLGLKSLDGGKLAGATVHYVGVPEAMRSSWEALYARVIVLCMSRTYVYEPMGFPLFDPSIGRIETYHPDFFELRISGSNEVQSRIVEIKGQLTRTSQRKMQIFKAQYLNDDFSGVPSETLPLIRSLNAQAREQSFQQFRMKIDKDTRLVVFGALPWDHARMNFIESTCENGKLRDGIIPRLARRFPNLAMDHIEPYCSRNQRDKSAREFSSGLYQYDPVRPLKTETTSIPEARSPLVRPSIATSEKVFSDNFTQLELILLASCVARGMLRLAADHGLADTAMHEIAARHGDSASDGIVMAQIRSMWREIQLVTTWGRKSDRSAAVRLLCNRQNALAAFNTYLFADLVATVMGDDDLFGDRSTEDRRITLSRSGIIANAKAITEALEPFLKQDRNFKRRCEAFALPIAECVFTLREDSNDPQKIGFDLEYVFDQISACFDQGRGFLASSLRGARPSSST